jgi:uncharacterized membrane protein YesL
MGKALTITWRGVVDAYSELFPMVGMNLVWFGLNLVVGVISLPVVFLLGFVGIPPDIGSILLVVLMVVVPNPAAAGIHNYANQLIKEERVEFALVWEGLKRYWAKALLLYAISVLGFVLLIANAVFYLRSESQVLRIFGIVWIYATYVWLSMQIYMLPLLVEQESKRIWYVVRNAALLALDSPFVTFVLLLLVLVLTGLSLVVPVLVTLISGALIGVIQHRAALTLLEKFRKRNGSATT